MNVTVCAREFDFAGVLTIEAPAPEIGEVRRRGNRIATLDGGAVANDFGFSDADRVFTIRFSPTQQQHDAAMRLLRLHSRVSASIEEAVFECIIGGYSVQNGTATLQLLPMRRLSE